MDNDTIIRVIDLLIARIYLDLAGVRPLTSSERLLIEDLASWWMSKN